MSRQHATPLLLPACGGMAERLVPLALGSASGISEDDVQRLVHAHPSLLPIAEVDAAFLNPVPICRELNTPAGPIDNLLLTPDGLPVLVECKLWRNPQARREVIGQTLDYAKELGRWSVSDLEREVRQRLKTQQTLCQLMAEAGHAVDEAAFNDALTRNLRRGRVLLLIVGDGIREGVESIVEYLQVHAGLHFTFALVELSFFRTPDGSLLVAPRVLTRTQLVTRTVVAVPDGLSVQDSMDSGDNAGLPAPTPIGIEQHAFWTEFIDGEPGGTPLRLDDPEQPLPKAWKLGFCELRMPVPDGSCWITIYRKKADGLVGLFLSWNKGSFGQRVVEALAEDGDAIQNALGGTAEAWTPSGVFQPADHLVVGPLDQAPNRARGLMWLRQRANEFVNTLRPRIKAAVADLKD